MKGALGEATVTEIRETLREMVSGGSFRGDVFFGEPMKNHTTLRIGGPADAFVVPEDLLFLKNLIIAVRERDIPLLPLGGGSNLLVADSGIAGVVVSLRFLQGMKGIREISGEVRFTAEAGVPLARLVQEAKEKGYRGIEGLAGIPGSLGGAVKGNSGSFGYEIGRVIESLAVMDRSGGVSTFGKETLTFGYRSTNVRSDSIILSADIRLERDDAGSVAKRMSGFLKEKRMKQPVSEWSAGCVFKNPGGTPAGRLIDEARCKGMRRGDIEVSGLHANFFVNRGNGKASDFIALMEDVKERVMRVFGVELEPEVEIVGKNRIWNAK